MAQDYTRQPSDVRVSMTSDDVIQNGEPPVVNPYASPRSASLPRDKRLSSSSGPGRRTSAIGASAFSPNSRMSLNNSSVSSFMGSSRNLKERKHVEDGCVILGSEGDNKHQYVTRFRINTQLQRAHMGQELLKEECCPVCEEENRETCCLAFFSFISGESFLLSLHISALLLGVAKEAFEVGEISNDLEITHSSLETVVAVLQVAIRIVAMRMSMKGIATAVKSTQHVTGEHSVTGRKLQQFVNTFTALGVCLIIFAIVCCVAFIVTDRMTWTILSNNFVMIVGTVTSNLLMLRIEKVKAAIRMDQHKAVLYESTLLLQDSVKANTEAKREAYTSKVKLFLDALMDTELFAQPRHIELDQKYKDKFDLVTNLEMMSYV